MKNFKEIQKFNQWWIIIFELIIVLVMTIVLINEYQNLGKAENGETFNSIIFSGALVLIIFVFINIIKLKTVINEKGISYQFYPLHWTQRTVLWQDLSDCKIRRYKPISEFGGWGLRGFGRKKILGFNRKGMALNIKGNIGIQLEFKDGGKLLIGTQEPDKVRLTIDNYSYKIIKNIVVS